MPDLEQARLTQAEAEVRRAALALELADLAGELAEARERLTASVAAGDQQAARESATLIESLLANRQERRRAIGEVQVQLARDLDELLGDELDLEGDVPLVLLPVRVEVRSDEGQTKLRVRIFHDTVHAETLDEGLTPAERAAGIEYWTELWPTGDAHAAWPALAATVGSRRASWVAEATRPTNLAERPGEEPVFPDTAPAGLRTAVARTLPDRFFVRVEQPGQPPKTYPGRAVPDELPVGLVDQSELTPLNIGDRDLPAVDESLRWLVDYKTAEDVGMAVTVPLAPGSTRVERLLVYGVRGSLGPEPAAARLDRLVRSHRFTIGAEFVRQGTPTNNTDSVRTEWSRRTPPGPPDLTDHTADPNSNAAVTAAALGLDGALLSTLPGAGDQEQGRARAFNTALWTTTWGDAIEHLTPGGRANGDKRLNNQSLDQVRDHWVDHVRGRGPVPALRFGRQPYGVLPVVMTDESWDPPDEGFVEQRLVPFVNKSMRWMWEHAVAAVPTIMNRPLDEAIPEILGTDAVLRALNVRTALSPDPIIFETMAAVNLPGDDETQQGLTKTLFVLSGVGEDALADSQLLSKKTRSLALPLVHETDQAFVTNLLEPSPVPMPHRSVLQVLLGHAAAVDGDARERLVPTEFLDHLVSAVREPVVDIDIDAVAMGLEAATRPGAFEQQAVARAADHLESTVGRLDARALADRHPIPAIAPGTAIQRLAGEEPRIDRLRTRAGMQLVGEVLHRSLWSSRFRSALETITAVDSIDERRLLLCETLDCCSHRLDAWITAAADRRLRSIRSAGPKGAFFGAYGVLANIVLETPSGAGTEDGVTVLHEPGDGGYLHAPGLVHAATAAVLRSGRLTHKGGDPDKDPLEIDLSSTRVRDALSLLGGMRKGQQLGALLGYRLERRLHGPRADELRLDRFIYVLRALAPLCAGKLTASDQAVQESLAASDVVDGVRLMEVPYADLEQKLWDGPADKLYIGPGGWERASGAEVNAVKAEIDGLASTYDAVADLLLAESVHQVVSGNPTRAAATLDAVGAGEAPPPDPEVVRTPRTGLPIRHQIAIVAPQPAAPVAGWATAPRAKAEPRLEAWARSALGDPTQVELAAGRRGGARPPRFPGSTLADARLSALDVLYDADGATVASSTLAVRVRAAVPGLGDDLSALAPTWELARQLRELLCAARPLDFPDVGRTPPEGGTHADEVIGRAQTATEELGALARTATEAAAAVDMAAAAEPIDEAALAAAGADLRAKASALLPYGVRSPSAPMVGPGQSTTDATLAEEATRRVAAANALLARLIPPPPAPSPPAKAKIELACQALAAVFGREFLVLPELPPSPAGKADLWAGAVGPGGVTARPGADIRPWLARAGTLREAAGTYGETLLLREALGIRPALRVVQTPAGAYGEWAGLPFPEARPPRDPLASTVVEIAGTSRGDPPPDLSRTIAGLVLDAWTEVVPRRLEKGPKKGPTELADVITTGIALNANAPGARPPQAILVALTPDGERWDADRLVAVLGEALALARMRCVTIEQIPYLGRYLPALYFKDWSLQGEPVIDWRAVAREFSAVHATKFVKAAP